MSAGMEGRDGRQGAFCVPSCNSLLPSGTQEAPGAVRWVPVRWAPAQCRLEDLPPHRTGQHQKAPDPVKTQMWGEMGAGEDRWAQPGRRWGCWDCSWSTDSATGQTPHLCVTRGPGGLSAPQRESSLNWAVPQPLKDPVFLNALCLVLPMKHSCVSLLTQPGEWATGWPCPGTSRVLGRSRHVQEVRRDLPHRLFLGCPVPTHVHLGARGLRCG